MYTHTPPSEESGRVCTYTPLKKRLTCQRASVHLHSPQEDTDVLPGECAPTLPQVKLLGKCTPTLPKEESGSQLTDRRSS